MVHDAIINGWEIVLITEVGVARARWNGNGADAAMSPSALLAVKGFLAGDIAGKEGYALRYISCLEVIVDFFTGRVSHTC
jgi:hypothetical protein